MSMPDPWDRSVPFFAEQQPDGTPRSSDDSGPARRTRIAGIGLLVTAAAVAVLLPSPTATADPSGHTWHRLRSCESGNNYETNTGNGHYGAYQFDQQTWQSVGGHGLPSAASATEQDARALILYRERGWQPWQCASILGLHEDGDAGSGYTSDIHIADGNHASKHPIHKAHPPKKSESTSSAPAFPGGSHWYRYGETNSHIKTFQDQMHARGYFPVGTGQYGPNTRHMVEQLQRVNGLVPNGYIGPNTWRLAWYGRYSATASAAKIPAFPGGSHWYHYGETSARIKVFQDRMHARGYFPVGTGQFGSNTLRLVKRLQQLNGLVPNGYLGPNTWRLAWVGRYND